MESKKKPATSRLKLNQLQVPVHIGVNQEERDLPQTVSFDIEVAFATRPSACESDSISETVCYDQISKVIFGICQAQNYALLEYLTEKAFNAISEILLPDSQLRVQTTKVSPPIQGLQGGASFEMSNLCER